MNYFAPERSTSNGFPCYLSPEGKAIAALQFPYVRPQLNDDGSIYFTLTLFLRTGRKSYSQFTLNVDQSNMPDFLDKWIKNPEYCMGDLFGYDFNYSDDFDLEPAASGGGTTTVKLEDLDL